LAERLHLSGIITVVVFAMIAARRTPEILPARVRIPSWAVWEVAVFVLNVLAFLLAGFQLKSIAARVTGPTRLEYVGVAAAVCIAVILARIAWVTAAAAVSRRRRDTVSLSARGAAVAGWCGMRGTVTLAAALALPAGGDGSVAFPHRDLILVTAFGVVLGTLVLQGLTLRPLLLWLRLKDDGSVDREVRLARVETLKAAVEAASASSEGGAVPVRDRYEIQLARAEADVSRATAAEDGGKIVGELGSDTSTRDVEATVVRAAMDAQRKRLLALRSDETIGDAAFQLVEEELDWVELGWAQLLAAGRSEPNKP
jgi:NhaP-type Na+/H+ or K+/H+ antiporter